MKTAQGSTNSETAETALGDGSVDNALLAESVQKTLGDLVGTIVLRNFLTEDEDLRVSLELLGQCLVQGITDGVLLDASTLSVGSGSEVDGASDGAGGLGEGGSERSLGGKGGSSGSGRKASSGTEESRHCESVNAEMSY